MKGGVILFRGSGTDARRYLESDRSRADDYYLEGGTALAEFTAVDARGEVIGELGLTTDEYAQWVDWINPFTGESMGKPRLPGEGRRGSPRFAEMVVNVPKSLSIAAALHPEVSEALDAAQRDAVAEIRSWLGQHSVTREASRKSCPSNSSKRWPSHTRPAGQVIRTGTSTSRSAHASGRPTRGADWIRVLYPGSRARSGHWAPPFSPRTPSSPPSSTRTASPLIQ